MAGGIFYLLMTVWFRSSADAGWDWTRALGPTIGLVVVWFVIGLLTGRRSSGKTGPSGPR
ncbi:hypothetical protein SAMN05660324_1105 [Klenkia brasiliensis]|uniref:Uncharacterized protein n=1 Tax=Klenkia brasiliensis TaxID=333142 RepID=A0A1G7PIL5_9ACTN|nr:hypothetical protein SAMN05660324_1105 [Klenkia brasiliensis]